MLLCKSLDLSNIVSIDSNPSSPRSRKGRVPQTTTAKRAPAFRPFDTNTILNQKRWKNQSKVRQPTNTSKRAVAIPFTKEMNATSSVRQSLQQLLGRRKEQCERTKEPRLASESPVAQNNRGLANIRFD